MSITRPPIGPIDLHKLYPATRDGTLTAYFRADDRWSNLVAVKLNQLAGTATGAYLPLTGGTLTGPLILAADPTTALGAATKQYVDAHAGGGGIPDAPSDGSAYGRLNAAWAKVLPLAGGTLTGNLAVHPASGDASVTINTGSSLPAWRIRQATTAQDLLISGTATDVLDLWDVPGGVHGAQVNGDLYVTGTTNLSANPTTALQAATKQYVDGLIPTVPAASSTLPLMDGTAAVGTGTTWARADHIHPSDTSRAPLASPTFTGTPAAPTATPGTNTTQLASTAFVTAAITALAAIPAPSSTTPLMDGTAAVGTGTTYARADHVHPSDTSRAPLASPTFTGVPAAPTATAGTNTTQLATTAFVQAAVGAAGGGTITGVTAGTGLTGGGTTGTVTVSVASAGITNALLATMAANTIKGNNTGATAAPVDLTVAQTMTLLGAAPLASPTFTGVPAAPTAAAGTSTTQLATTAFVTSALGGGGSGIAGLTAQRVLFGSAGGGIAQDAALTWDTTNKFFAAGASPTILRLMPDSLTPSAGDLTVNARITAGAWVFDDTTKDAFLLEMHETNHAYSLFWAPASANPPVWKALATLTSAQGTGTGPGTLTVPGEVTVGGNITTSGADFYRRGLLFGFPSATSPGYLILGAITMQWGYYTTTSMTAGAANGFTITLPRAFSANAFAAQALMNWASDKTLIFLSSLSTTTIQFVVYPDVAGVKAFSWLAIGPT